MTESAGGPLRNGNLPPGGYQSLENPRKAALTDDLAIPGDKISRPGGLLDLGTAEAFW